MEQIPHFEKIAEDVEAAYNIIQNFKNDKYVNPKDPNMRIIAVTSLYHCLRDALIFAEKSYRQPREV